MKIIYILFAICLPCTLFAGEFCKHGNLSNIEKIICGSEITKKLDNELNKLYHQLLVNSDNRIECRINQRWWIKNVRNKCIDIECLNNEYSKRIISILEDIALSQKIDETKMTNNEAICICNDIAKLSKDHKLSTLLIKGLPDYLTEIPEIYSEKWQISKADQEAINNNIFTYTYPEIIYNLKTGKEKKLTKFASFFTGGSCSSYNVFNVDQVKNPHIKDRGIDTVPDPGEDIRWATWGGREFPAIYKNRNVLISGSIHAPQMVSWIKPDGRIRPLCLLRKVSVKKVEGFYKNRDVCEAISANNVEKTIWSDVTNSLPIQHEYNTYKQNFIRLFNFDADSVEMQIIDLDGDGTKERIAKFIYDSTAGCGSHQEWLAIIKDKLDGIATGKMNDALNYVSGSSIEIFRYRGIYFIEAKKEDERWEVYRLVKNTLDKVCDFSESIESEIDTFYDVQ